MAQSRAVATHPGTTIPQGDALCITPAPLRRIEAALAGTSASWGRAAFVNLAIAVIIFPVTFLGGAGMHCRVVIVAVHSRAAVGPAKESVLVQVGTG